MQTLYLILLFLPVLDCLLLLLANYVLFIYMRCLNIHKRNVAAV